jgi:hypothetical protein
VVCCQTGAPTPSTASHSSTAQYALRPHRGYYYCCRTCGCIAWPRQLVQVATGQQPALMAHEWAAQADMAGGGSSGSHALLNAEDELASMQATDQDQLSRALGLQAWADAGVGEVSPLQVVPLAMPTRQHELPQEQPQLGRHEQPQAQLLQLRQPHHQQGAHSAYNLFGSLSGLPFMGNGGHVPPGRCELDKRMSEESAGTADEQLPRDAAARRGTPFLSQAQYHPNQRSIAASSQRQPEVAPLLLGAGGGLHTDAGDEWPDRLVADRADVTLDEWDIDAASDTHSTVSEPGLPGIAWQQSRGYTLGVMESGPIVSSLPAAAAAAPAGAERAGSSFMRAPPGLPIPASRTGSGASTSSSSGNNSNSRSSARSGVGMQPVQSSSAAAGSTGPPLARRSSQSGPQQQNKHNHHHHLQQQQPLQQWAGDAESASTTSGALDHRRVDWDDHLSPRTAQIRDKPTEWQMAVSRWTTAPEWAPETHGAGYSGANDCNAGTLLDARARQDTVARVGDSTSEWTASARQLRGPPPVSEVTNMAGPLYAAALQEILSRVSAHLLPRALQQQSPVPESDGASLIFSKVELSAMPPPQSLVAALRRDGCAVCLHREPVVVAPLVALHCWPHGCVHACHTECMVSPFWFNKVDSRHAAVVAVPPLRPAAITAVEAATTWSAALAVPPRRQTAADSNAPGACVVDVSVLHVLSSGLLMHKQLHGVETRTSGQYGRQAYRVYAVDPVGTDTAVADATTMVAGPLAAARVAEAKPQHVPALYGRLTVRVTSYARACSWEATAAFDLSTVLRAVAGDSPPIIGAWMPGDLARMEVRLALVKASQSASDALPEAMAHLLLAPRWLSAAVMDASGAAVPDGFDVIGVVVDVSQDLGQGQCQGYGLIVGGHMPSHSSAAGSVAVWPSHGHVADASGGTWPVLHASPAVHREQPAGPRPLESGFHVPGVVAAPPLPSDQHVYSAPRAGVPVPPSVGQFMPGHYSSAPPPTVHTRKPSGASSAAMSTQARLRVLANLPGPISDAAKSQSGSKFLQQHLTAGDPDVVAYVLDRVEHDLPDVIQDMFGNYFVQALFRHGTSQQRERMLRALLASMPDVACDRNGTYALQSIVDTIELDCEQHVTLLCAGLATDTLRVVCNNHGTHVVQRLLKRFSPAQCEFVHVAARTEVARLATHANGIGVLLLSMDTADRVTRAAIMLFTVRHAAALSQHAYGNYAVQHLLGKRNRGVRVGSFPGLADDLRNVAVDGGLADSIPPAGVASAPAFPADNDAAAGRAAGADGVFAQPQKPQHAEVRAKAASEPNSAHSAHMFHEDAEVIAHMTVAMAVCRALRGRYVELSRHKYASNVVEKCAVWGGPERVQLLQELFVDADVSALLVDSYANYVLQTALQSSHPHERRQLVALVNPHLAVFATADTPSSVRAKWSIICARLLASAPVDSSDVAASAIIGTMSGAAEAGGGRTAPASTRCSFAVAAAAGGGGSESLGDAASGLPALLETFDLDLARLDDIVLSHSRRDDSGGSRAGSFAESRAGGHRERERGARAHLGFDASSATGSSSGASLSDSGQRRLRRGPGSFGGYSYSSASSVTSGGGSSPDPYPGARPITMSWPPSQGEDWSSSGARTSSGTGSWQAQQAQDQQHQQSHQHFQHRQQQSRAYAASAGQCEHAAPAAAHFHGPGLTGSGAYHYDARAHHGAGAYRVAVVERDPPRAVLAGGAGASPGRRLAPAYHPGAGYSYTHAASATDGTYPVALALPHAHYSQHQHIQMQPKQQAAAPYH